MMLNTTATTIDNHIKLLKADLDAVGKSAKRALTNAKAATLKMVTERISK